MVRLPRVAVSLIADGRINASGGFNPPPEISDLCYDVVLGCGSNRLGADMRRDENPRMVPKRAAVFERLFRKYVQHRPIQ